MKLISLNVEGNIHLNKVLPFLEKEAPDVVCLMEATDKHVQYLQEHGYSTSFLPRCIREQQGEEFTEGLILASKSPIAFTSYRYYNPREEILKETFDEVSSGEQVPPTITL